MRELPALTGALALTLLSIATTMAFENVPPPAGHSLGNIKGGNFRKANIVMEKNCVLCHSKKVIEDAIAAGKDMQKIQERMVQKGARLSADDKRVLGIFWEQTPLKKR